METSLKDLGIQNQAMSFQEMVREKRAPVVQPPPPPMIPSPMSPHIMPDAMPMPVQARPQPPMPPPMAPMAQMQQPMMNPMLPFAEAQAQAGMDTKSEAKCDAKPKGGFCMDGYQKELLALAVIASILSSPMAQDKLAEVSYFRENRLFRAIASGVAVAVLFTLLKKFMF